MTKKQVCDFIRNNIGWHFDRRQVSAAVSMVYAMYIHESLDKRLKSFELLSKEYTSQSVSEDTEGYYITLPASIVGLPSKTDGVLAIRNPGSGDLDYFPMTLEDVMYSKGLDSDTINTFTGYYVIEDKIRFYNFDDSISSVTLVLAIQFDDFDWDDEVNLPSGNDFNITEAASNMLLNKPVRDLKNDNDK